MMQPDIDWILELFDRLKEGDANGLENWLGIINEIQSPNKQTKTSFLTPNNLRLKRIILNYENGTLDRIALEGDTFALSFSFLLSLTEGYKRTFNTYDAIDDEQFMFYPGKPNIPIVAIESWIPPEKQTDNHRSIRFNDVYFHLNNKKVPYHFRDGWHLIVPPK